MIFQNTETLKARLIKDGFTELAERSSFVIDDKEYTSLFDELKHQQPDLFIYTDDGIDTSQAEEEAAFRWLTHTDRGPKGPTMQPDMHWDLLSSVILQMTEARKEAWLRFVILTILLLVMMILSAVQGHAQAPAPVVVSSCGTPPANFPSTGNPAFPTVDTNGNTCTPSGSGGTASNFGNASPAAGTAAGARDTNGNMQPLQLDGAGTGQNLDVNCKVGCASAGDTVGSQVTLNSGSGAGSHADVALAGGNGAVVNFTSSTSPNFTVVCRVSPDGGTTFLSSSCVFLDPVSGAMSTSLVNPGNGQWQLAWVGAESNVQVFVSAYTSGSVAAQLRATVTRPWTLVGGSDGTNLRILSTDTSGKLQVIANAPAGGNFAINLSQENGTAVTSTPTAYGTSPTGNVIGVNAAVTNTPQMKVLGNAGGIMDAAGQNASSPANELLIGCQFNTSPTTITSGNVSPVQCTNGGALNVNVQGGVATGYAQASTTSGQLGPLNQAAVTTGVPTYTTGQTDPLSLTTSGALRGDMTSVGGSAFALGQQAIASSLPVVGPAVTYNSVQPTLSNGQTEADFQISTRGALIVNPGTETFNVTVNTALPQGSNTLGAVTQASGPWTINHTQTAGITLGATAVANFGSAPSAANVDAVNASLFAGTTGLAATGSSLNVACTSGCAGSSPSDTVGNSQSFTATNQQTTVVMAGENGAEVELTSASSPLLTLVAEVSGDGGTNWRTAVFFDNVSGAMSTSLVNPANGTYQIGWIGAASQARVRSSALTSGSITGQIRATTTRTYSVNYGSDGTNLRPISTDTSGRVNVNLAANQSVNLAQIAATTTLVGNGASGNGAQRVNISNDNTAIANWGQGATGSAVPSGAVYLGGQGSANLTGITVCDNWTAINQTSGTQLFSGTSSKKTYFCAINLVSATAQNIALVAGTGSVCATSTHAIAGGTTAATGWNLAANSGLTQGSGIGVIMQASTAADNVCLLQSGSGQVSGAVAWTQY